MRLIIILTGALLAGCSNPAAPELSTGRPALEVADAALAAGVPEVALRVADGQLERHPFNPDARLRKGLAQYQLGDLAGARASFDAVLAKQPLSYEAQIGLGRVELATNAKEAQLHFQQMAALLPRNVTVLTDLGIAYDLLGQHELAQKMYRQALDISPNLVSARNNLGLSLALSAQPAQAAEVLRPLDATRAESARMRANLAAVLSGSEPAAPATITVAAPPAPAVPPQGSDAGS